MRRAIVACVLMAGNLAQAATLAPSPLLDATVTRVVDGDSLWLELSDAGSTPLEVRLNDIDAPEICQPWGPEARDALRDMVLNKPVQIRISGHDTYGRTLATLYVGGTLNVNRALVKEGHAWSSRTRFDRGPYVAEERLATALHRGFNGGGGAVMPKDFRRSHGPCAPGEAASSAAPAATAAMASPRASITEQGFRCDGRTYCNQMHSCAEATFFLKNCPGVKMDGNHDGVPCEQQWCGR